MRSRDLIVTRVFDASVERLWHAWTHPEHITQWWEPAGFTSNAASLDVREGGTSLVAMRSPEGRDLYHKWTYHKVAPRRRIEFLQDWVDLDGARIDPVQLGFAADLPQEVRHLVIFIMLGDNKTEMTVIEYGLTSSKKALESSRTDLQERLDKLAATLGATNTESRT